MSALGAAAVLVFSGAAVAAGVTIVATIAPQWQRIVRLSSGQVEPMPAEDTRWRDMHLAADRRRPFHKIRAVSNPWRRGLPGWMVRR